MSTKAERNRALVLEAMTALFQRRDPLAVGRLYASEYIQHNPGIPQGREALAKLVAKLPSTVFYEPGMIIAEGEYVAIHGRIRGWAPKPQVVVDIFRVKDGRLAEHWDVMQDEVPTQGSKSGSSMFAPDEGTVQSATNRDAINDVMADVDYATLLHANLARVFGERDVARRMDAIRELYAEDAVLNEPHATAMGHVAVCDAVTALLRTLPPDFVFTAVRPAMGHHGIGHVQWRCGPVKGPVAATGMDIARFEDGRIQELTVFIDSPN
ncbi:nuclear transport factor 2 family protein [Steroidobacter cummioxidans]|uniref:nuclear transport factor 2 family protein n=1 Tax=Steroidobacter cummioxidans TaxID=1803913 RepID=UPI0019D46F4E|nr:nuclear transport factor 2 family protein [Steroidobacter cummioxidans]